MQEIQGNPRKDGQSNCRRGRDANGLHEQLEPNIIETLLSASLGLWASFSFVSEPLLLFGGKYGS